MKDGMIELDSSLGKELGFVSSKFDGYLWKKDNAIIISFIISKKKGNFKKLVEKILSTGHRVDIPTPLGKMQEIVQKNKYKHRIEYIDDMGPCHVWSLEPK